MCFRMWSCIAVLVFPPALFAQTRLTLNDAIAEALGASPQLMVGAARVDAARGLARQAGLSPNPRLVLQSENTRFSGTPGFSYPVDADSYVLLGQTFETGGKRDRRVELAAENVKKGEVDLQLQRQQIAGRVSAAYWTAAGAARFRDLLKEEDTRFERLVQYHRDRVREGASPEIDLLRVEVERDRLASAANIAGQEAERARIMLFREMGKTEFPSVEFADAVEGTGTATILGLDQVFERRREIALARQGISQARANLNLQQANAKTDPDVSLGYKRTAGFNTLYAAVQIPLPVRNKNQGQLEAASAELRAAESQVAAAQALVRGEVEMARSAYEARQKLLASLATTRNHADEVYAVAEAAYREGGLDLLRLLDAERIQLEARSAYVRALFELRQSVVALSIAQGSF